MSVNIKKLTELNDLVAMSFRRKHVTVLNPDKKDSTIEGLDDHIIYDKVEWNITDEFKEWIDKLSKNEDLSNEEKILAIYEKICQDYVYDDNLISYIKKVDVDTFSVPDWYGRNVDSEWEKNREEHNRRVCFELARYLAKGLTELLKDNDDFNICILWNKELTHYFVGLTCNDYSVTLDLDDFFNIKDLTRLKTGLTAQGIKILDDSENKFTNALNSFNEGKLEHTIKKIQQDIDENESSQNEKEDDKSSCEIEKDEDEDIVFLTKAMEILSQKYNIDSQGIFEYLKEIVDIRLGPERKKVWKKIEGNTEESTRYIRCLLVNIGTKKYLIDVDEKTIRPFEKEDFENKRATFIPYNALMRNSFNYYDGR